MTATNMCSNFGGFRCNLWIANFLKTILTDSEGELCSQVAAVTSSLVRAVIVG